MQPSPSVTGEARPWMPTDHSSATVEAPVVNLVVTIAVVVVVVMLVGHGVAALARPLRAATGARFGGAPRSAGVRAGRGGGADGRRARVGIHVG